MSWTPTLRQLEYVVAVADTGRFGLAARSLAVSQPALSKQVKEVEEGLGVFLFERGHRGTTPTPAGDELVGRARRVMAEAREFTDAAAMRRDPLAGTLRLGAIPTLPPYLLPPLLKATAADLPDLDLRLVEEQTETLGDRLQRGELDLALVALPFARQGVSVLGLYEEPFFLVTPTEHPLAGTTPVLSSRVGSHPLLLLRQGHCLRDHALSACRLSLQTPARVEATSLGTLLLMVRQGLGATLVPEMALPEDTEGLCIRPFAPPVPSRGIGLWWRPSSPRAALFRRLAGLLRRHRP